MAPVDQVGHTMMVPGLPGHGGMPPPQPGSRSIPLSTLIEYLIQRTYHELTVLSELLPRKTDMERKIEIVQFASRTRQLFVRLLALVKWANSASKVDKCARMSQFLDEQAMYFVDTADLLARMARETLLHASLPSFSLPCAIDVLTTGTYPRLPVCIKEKIVPPDPITKEEKEQTLTRLNQIIEHRLVTSDLPRHMRKPAIRKGRVKFTVKHEFEVSLTLMGDGANIPWRLLDIDFLVEDPETGDGKALVHSLQVNYIHQLVQSRLIEATKPLHDLYNCLHSFCQSLQLEVLHSQVADKCEAFVSLMVHVLAVQTQRLIQQRLREHIRIEDYTAGKCLVISYWREPFRRDVKPFSPVYKLNIHVDELEPDKPLQLAHFPQIQGSQSTRVAQAIKSDHLSLEKLLVHTIQIRSVAKLKDLEREFRLIVPTPCRIRDLPTVLYVPVMKPSMESECLCVTVNTMTGNFMTSVNFKTSDTTAEIEDCINGDRKGLRRHLSSLRMMLALERCKRSIQHLQVNCSSYLPLVNLSSHPLEALGPHKVFLKLPKEQHTYLVVRVTESKKSGVEYDYHLLQCQPSSLEEEPLAPPPPSLAPGEPQPEVPRPKVFLKAMRFVKIDKWTATHGPYSKVFDPEAEQLSPLSRKRKLLLGESTDVDVIAKKPRGSPYFVPELMHILSMCEDRMPFEILATQLEKFGLHHQGVRVEGEGAGLTLSLLRAPPCASVSKETMVRLQKDLISCKFRIQRKGSRIWLVEYLFANCPVESTNPREQGRVHCVYCTYDLSSSDAISKVVESVLDDWMALAHLYQAVLDFSQALHETHNFQGAIEVKSFNYKRLILTYGHNKSYMASLQYLTLTQQFHITLGSCGASSVANCHSLLLTHLQNDLNTNQSVADLAQILCETWSLMASIGKLNLAPQLALSTKNTHPTPNFSLVPQSSTHLRLIFRNSYCLDLHSRSGHLVAIRDGAYSIYDTSKVVEGLTPTPGLLAFLNLFVDESVALKHARRRSVTEDDNPPSPVGMDTMDTFISSISSSAGSRGLAKSRGDSGYRFPMTPPSNPHTPASPGGGKLGQPHPSPSHAGANFPLPSPPSLQHIITPSPSNVMAPSPGAPNPSPSAFMPPPSPSSLGIHMSPATQFISPQGMIEGSGSPYPAGSANLTMPSPRGSTWPQSPSIQPGGPSPAPRPHNPSPGHVDLMSPQKDLERLCTSSVLSPPSRILPQKSWAASIPTLLSHEALNKLFSPGPPPGASVASPQSTGPLTCPLERFLCCSFLLRHLKRIIPSTENLSQIVCNEPGVVMFKAETLQLRVQLNPATLQSLHLKATPNTDLPANTWDSEEIQVLEKFFETKVASGLYKPNALTSFGRLMGAPLRILKDFVQIMRLELMPEPNMKWGVQWCLTMPHNMANMAEPGCSAIVIKGKVFFMLQLTPVSGGESIQVPILYEVTTNQTQMMEQQPMLPSPASVAISSMFKRFTEFNPKPADCSIYPAIRELLSNLNITTPPSQAQPSM